MSQSKQLIESASNTPRSWRNVEIRVVAQLTCRTTVQARRLLASFPDLIARDWKPGLQIALADLGLEKADVVTLQPVDAMGYFKWYIHVNSEDDVSALRRTLAKIEAGVIKEATEPVNDLATLNFDADYGCSRSRYEFVSHLGRVIGKDCLHSYQIEDSASNYFVVLHNLYAFDTRWYLPVDSQDEADQIVRQYSRWLAKQ